MMKKTKKVKRKKLIPLPKLIKKLDGVFSKFIRQRDKTCFTCPGPNQNAGHYVKRGHMSLRFNEKNVHSQCVKCNLWLNGNLEVYAYRLTELYGIDILRELNNQKHQIKKWTREELYQLIDHYKNRLI